MLQPGFCMPVFRYKQTPQYYYALALESHSTSLRIYQYFDLGSVMKYWHKVYDSDNGIFQCTCTWIYTEIAYRFKVKLVYGIILLRLGCFFYSIYTATDIYSHKNYLDHRMWVVQFYSRPSNFLLSVDLEQQHTAICQLCKTDNTSGPPLHHDKPSKESQYSILRLVNGHMNVKIRQLFIV